MSFALMDRGSYLRNNISALQASLISERKKRYAPISNEINTNTFEVKSIGYLFAVNRSKSRDEVWVRRTTLFKRVLLLRAQGLCHSPDKKQSPGLRSLKL